MIAKKKRFCQRFIKKKEGCQQKVKKKRKSFPEILS